MTREDELKREILWVQWKDHMNQIVREREEFDGFIEECHHACDLIGPGSYLETGSPPTEWRP